MQEIDGNTRKDKRFCPLWLEVEFAVGLRYSRNVREQMVAGVALGLQNRCGAPCVLGGFDSHMLPPLTAARVFGSGKRLRKSAEGGVTQRRVIDLEQMPGRCGVSRRGWEVFGLPYARVAGLLRRGTGPVAVEIWSESVRPSARTMEHAGPEDSFLSILALGAYSGCESIIIRINKKRLDGMGGESGHVGFNQDAAHPLHRTAGGALLQRELR